MQINIFVVNGLMQTQLLEIEMTSNLITIDLKEISFPVNKETNFGSLTDLWTVGNAHRIKCNKPQLSLQSYLKSDETKQFIEAIENYIGEIPINIKEGRYGGTWAHLYILLDAAGKLDASFKVQIYKRVIDGGLLKWRDDSGDSYKALNIAIDMMTYEKSGNHPDVSVYIYVADCIRENIKPTGGKWNTATHEELSLRTRIENTLISFCKAGVVDDYNHLCKLISKIK